MFGFTKRTPPIECGVILDIGSGSVGIAIVVSDSIAETSTSIWTHREYVLITDATNTSISLRGIHTAMVNAFLQLGSAGMKALREYEMSLKITVMQVTVSAPWAYTVSKNVQYSDEHPFTITDELLDELAQTAEKQAVTCVLESSVLQENNLTILDNKPIGVVANGYLVEDPEGVTTRNTSLAHITAITQKKIIELVADSKEKLIPRAVLYTHSFMLVFYETLKRIHPNINEVCLIDITSEGTEIGIVRENILKHDIQMPFGTYSIAREIAKACAIPNEEAYTYMKGGTSFVDTKLSHEKKKKLDEVVAAYEESLQILFKQTGDTLAIPKTIFLHTDAHTESFFTQRILNAGKIATGITHVVHHITSELLNDATQSDTAITLSSRYFHQQHIDKVEEDS